MNPGITVHGRREWSDAQRRAEAYLRALSGTLGSAEEQLLAEALTTARKHHRAHPAAHPVTLVMESLFALLPVEAAAAAIAMVPPVQRVTMLPEKTEFPFHDCLRQLFRTQLLPFAGTR
jgi:hypothetical protein